MTQAGIVTQNESQTCTVDPVQQKRLQLFRIAERLLEQATDPNFTGVIQIELKAKNGQLSSEFKTSVIRYEH